MLSMADDVAYAATHLDQQQGSNPIGLAGQVAWQWGKFEFSLKTLEMLKKGPKTGYYIPFTRGGRGKIASFGQARGWWGPEGRMFMGSMGEAAPYYNKTFGLLRFNASRRAAVGAVGARAANIAGAKYIVGRVAGVASAWLMPIFWGQMAWSAAAGTYGFINKLANKNKGLELGGYFPETQAAVTSRQRALQAITSSRLQARSAIGNEAMLFHR